jgi:nucleoside-diphosphate-sugar epimerase
MVVGDGLIAKRFATYRDDERYLVFASGVSNSKNTDDHLYKREADLLLQCLNNNTGKTFIYFSTCSFYDNEEQQSSYVLHKKVMEDLIKEKAGRYYIFRISNLAGHTNNPNTILNFFYNHIVKQSPFSLWVNTWRNLIDIDDAFMIMDYIIVKSFFKNSIINIANTENYPVKAIVTAIEQALHLQADYTSIDKGHFFSIDTSAILPVVNQLKINFDENYLPGIINKYFATPA